ncbi:MAG: hypothetical protein ACREX4_01175 [Gammaproteobacteria bacterium]
MICLSFDTDHMANDRMQEFFDSIPIPGRGTFFCTQRYDTGREDGHEFCPHPCLEQGTDWEKELDVKRREFPDALGWRSHSCIFSHILAQKVASMGYRYVSTHDDFGRAGLRPHRHCWGVWQMPIFYMDNLDFSQGRFWPGNDHRPFARSVIGTAMTETGIYVFDFHPIHLVLNTTSPNAYFERRGAFRDGAPIKQLRCHGYGTLEFYLDLCRAMRDRGLVSVAMQDALDAFATRESGLTTE